MYGLWVLSLNCMHFLCFYFSSAGHCLFCLVVNTHTTLLSTSVSLSFFPKIIIINWQMIDGGYVAFKTSRGQRRMETHRTDVKSLLDMRRLLKDHYQKQWNSDTFYNYHQQPDCLLRLYTGSDLYCSTVFIFTLRAKLSSAVYCYRSCLFVCVCMFVCGSVTIIMRNCMHRSSPNWVCRWR